MSQATLERMYDLLGASLVAWGTGGDVRRDPDGAIFLSAAGVDVRVAAAAPNLPFRWMVTIGGRTRGAASVAGVLRAIRGAIDPGYERLPLRVAPSP